MANGLECAWTGCDSKHVYRITTRKIFKCAEYRRQFSVRKGTVFEESKLPLRKWFIPIWMWMDNPKGVAALRLANQITIWATGNGWMLCWPLSSTAADRDGSS